MPSATVSRPHRTPESPPIDETPPVVEAPADESVDDSFRILNSYALVIPARSHGGILSNGTFGEIAWIPGRGRVARWPVRFPSGIASWGYRTDPLDPDVPQEILHTPSDEASSVVQAMQDTQSNPRKRLTPLEATQLELERDRFSAQWPLVSEALGVKRIRPNRLFEPGPVHRPAMFNPDWGDDVDWSSFRDRHTSGDFGEEGRFDPTPLTEEQLWSLPLQNQLVRNRASIATGVGVVRSLFPLQGRPGAPQFALSVVTAMIPGRGPVTVMLPRPASHRPH